MTPAGAEHANDREYFYIVQCQKCGWFVCDKFCRHCLLGAPFIYLPVPTPQKEGLLGRVRAWCRGWL